MLIPLEFNRLDKCEISAEVVTHNVKRPYFESFVRLSVNVQEDILVFKSISVNSDASMSASLKGYMSRDMQIKELATNELGILMDEME